MKVLLGVTGSVATVLNMKLVDALKTAGYEVQVVATESSVYFFDADAFPTNNDYETFEEAVRETRLWRDQDEWPSHKVEDRRFAERSWKKRYEKDQSILHIELRKWADVFVVAPLSANTLAKMSIGMCDNLLTSIFRAWDFDKPVVLAPAMNTFMWSNPWTDMQMNILSSVQGPAGGHNVHFVDPQSKVLACGDEGIGAMADISNIVDVVNKLDKTKMAQVAALASK